MPDSTELKIIFFMSSERSGSTLMTRIINQHPQICGPFPPHLVEFLSPHVWRYGDLQNDEAWRRMLSDAVDVMNAKLGSWKTEVTVDELFDAVPERTLRSLILYIYQKEARANGKQTVFIRERYLYHIAPYTMNVFPDAKYIYLVRDPRDMALSWKNFVSRTGAVMKGAQHWKEDQQAGIPLLYYLQDNNRMMLQKYEDLLDDPEFHLKRLCEFLEAPFTEAMLDFYKDSLTQKDAPKNNAWHNLTKPLMKQNYGKYREALSKDEIQYVEAICRQEMKFLGYELDYPDFDVASGLPELENRLIKHEYEVDFDSIAEYERTQRQARIRIQKRLETMEPKPAAKELVWS